MLQLASDGREFLFLLLDAHTLSTLYYFISQFAFVGGILLLLRVNLRRYLIPKFLLLLLHVFYRFASHYLSRAYSLSSRTRRAPPATRPSRIICLCILCVYFVAFCFSVILAVSCSSSKQKKNEKKYCSSYSIFARAHFSSHTLFDFKKLQVSHQDLYISPYKKLSVSPCWRFAPSLPFITRSVVPAAGEKSLSVSSIPTGQQSKHTAGIEGKEDGSVFCASKDSLPFPHTVVVTGRRRWGHTFDVVLV